LADVGTALMTTGIMFLILFAMSTFVAVLITLIRKGLKRSNGGSAAPAKS
jgi:hypothetical protein